MLLSLWLLIYNKFQMSLITNIGQQPMAKFTIYDALGRYIPRTLLQSVTATGYKQKCNNEEEVIQAILSNSDDMLRMYGTARELLLNLKVFQNFPLSHVCFGFDPKEPYTTIPTAYRNMDGVPFMNKADSISLLRTVINRDMFENPSSFRLFLSMQAILLKSCDERIDGVCEFIKYEAAWHAKFQYSFTAIHKDSKQMPLPHEWDYEKALGMFKVLLPVWTREEYCGFENDLKTFFDSKSGNFDNVIRAIFSFVGYLKHSISMNPEMFLPYDQEKNPNSSIVVRVFEYHDVQFVLKSELFNAINIRNPDSKRLECKDIDGKLMTMSFEKVQRIYKDRIENIEFIKCPIQRTNHKAVPIMTPSGGHCILAMDFLFEVLNELIFTHRVFQKIDSKNSNVLRRFFLQMTDLFHHKSIFFVTLEEQEKRNGEMIAFCKHLENIPAKFVRNAEKDGFTVQRLKEELEYLGLTEMFPDVQNYAESVYSEVLKTKREEFLRTCDLFKAVEKCLLNCIFERFPALRLFLHTQNACHLFPDLNCDFCNASNEDRFKNTNWNEPHFKKAIPTFVISNPENTYLYEAKLPDGTELTNSYNRFFNMEQIRKNNIKYFIYDQQDLVYFAENSKNLKPRRLRDECRYSLDAFQTFHPEKKLYIRTIPSMRLKREESRRVFAEEVLDLIPVVLRQQNTPISENDDRLAKYRMKWDTNNEASESTISLTEFWYILEEFDIDKTRITIIPDPVYELALRKMIKDLRMPTLNVIGPHGEQMMRFEQAVFHTFEVVFCNQNWRMDLCKTHGNCLTELKDRIIGFMKTYSQMDEGTYVTVEHVESVIQELKNHCSFQLQSKTPGPLVELQKRKCRDLIRKEEFISNCLKFGLTRFMSTMQYPDSLTEVFNVRVYYLTAWNDEYFGCEMLDLYDVILNETAFRLFTIVKTLDFDKLPNLSASDSMSFLKPGNLLDMLPRATATEKGTPKKTVTVEQTVDPIIEKDVEDATQKTSTRKEVPEVQTSISKDTQKTPASEKAPDDIQAAKVEAPSPDDVQKTSESEKASEVEPPCPDDIQKTSLTEKLPTVDINQSKCCTKCLRTSEMCNEAEKELKMTQNKLEKYEKKARRTDEVEKELKALKVETKKKEKEAERRALEIEKKEKEMEVLRAKVFKMEASETRMRLNEKNLEISRNEMQAQIADLTSQLKDKNQKIEELKDQVTQLTRKEKSLNNKISKKEDHVKKLQEKNRELSIRISHLEQSNLNLLEEITTISREGLGSPDDPKNRLLRLEKILESYSHGYQLKHSKEMVEKLKSCSDSVKIHQIADYERDQYDGKVMRYVHELEMNIQKIKTTKDCTLITPLPEQPSFSNRFMDLYWKIINNQPITSTDLEVRDSECFICYEEMIYSQKTMICKECKKQTHWKCASKWLKTHRSCPHCRREMLDPNEFPDLA
ncbi:hypothetical protein B9Z55_009056 [Caenorhabditis nigoni]|uniref:RING-type domain-containing protein n=1 Tax=Caenorhabditis nigoni TaxID=1611254 RepID=A0A2G5UQB8_9PELO|nr:hypothetical protein B9Z55_009056 [Caenorhabditis nigoni]